MAMWAEKPSSNSDNPVLVTLLLMSSFLPSFSYSIVFHHSTSCRCMHTIRDHLLQNPLCFLSPLSLQVSFILFTELMQLPLHTVQAEASTSFGGRLLGHWVQGWVDAGKSHRPTASSQKTHKLWFKLWFWKHINAQSVYLKSANKHHMLQKLSLSSKLWWSQL